jgi:hypothetical protein
MHKSAVAYAIGKLMQVLGGILIVPLAIAVYDNYYLYFSQMLAHPEIF